MSTKIKFRTFPPVKQIREKLEISLNFSDLDSSFKTSKFQLMDEETGWKVKEKFLNDSKKVYVNCYPTIT